MSLVSIEVEALKVLRAAGVACLRLGVAATEDDRRALEVAVKAAAAALVKAQTAVRD